MKVRVVYSTQVRTALGIASEELEVADQCTLPSLLAQLSARHPTVLEQLVFDGKQLRPSILLFIGDRQTKLDDAIQLADGDEVTIFSAISGG